MAAYYDRMWPGIMSFPGRESCLRRPAQMAVCRSVSFSDGSNQYEISTIHFKHGEPKTVSIQDMQTSLWKVNESGGTYIDNATLDVNGTQLVWTFNVPAEADLSKLVITEVAVHTPEENYYSTDVIDISAYDEEPIIPNQTPSSESIQSVKEFVERCYSLILGRQSDETGLSNWTNALLSGTANASQIISGFMSSEEYANQQKDNSETVEILYNTMLGRPSDPAGKQDWTGVLDGNNVNTVINGFCGSQEFLGLCAEYGIEAGSVPTNGGQSSGQTGSGLEGFVARCYSEALGRSADEGGFSYWRDILRNKEQTPQQVAAGFVFSQEMNAADKIQSNPDALLDSLYKLYLGRSADEAGKEYWKQRIAEGISLEDLNAGFANSAEFTGIVASYGLE